MSTPHIEHFVDERGNFIYRAEFEGSFLSKDEAKELSKYVSGILDENAKLRELVRIGIEYCCNGYCEEEDGCPLYEGRFSCSLTDKARELGVEL